MSYVWPQNVSLCQDDSFVWMFFFISIMTKFDLIMMTFYHDYYLFNMRFKKKLSQWDKKSS